MEAVDAFEIIAREKVSATVSRQNQSLLGGGRFVCGIALNSVPFDFMA